MNLAIKRVYDRPDPSDGVRILVDRLWPRALTKEKASLDLWLKLLAPTTELRKWFDHRPERYDEFRIRYLAELKENPAVAEALTSIGDQKTTLLYGAKDPRVNHAGILAEFLMSSGNKSAPAKKPKEATRTQDGRSNLRGR